MPDEMTMDLDALETYLRQLALECVAKGNNPYVTGAKLATAAGLRSMKLTDAEFATLIDRIEASDLKACFDSVSPDGQDSVQFRTRADSMRRHAFLSKYQPRVQSTLALLGIKVRP